MRGAKNKYYFENYIHKWITIGLLATVRLFKRYDKTLYLHSFCLLNVETKKLFSQFAVAYRWQHLVQYA